MDNPDYGFRLQLGILSFGEEPCAAGGYSVWTNVAAYTDWIAGETPLPDSSGICFAIASLWKQAIGFLGF